MHRFIPSLAIAAVTAAVIVAGNVAAASTADTPDRPAATAAAQCRYATYGDLMRWGETTSRRLDWQAQLAACGVHALPAALAHAFHHSRTMGRYGRYQYDVHPVFGMDTNSHRPAADALGRTQACAEAWTRLAASGDWQARHAHLPADDEARQALLHRDEALRDFIARHCRPD